VAPFKLPNSLLLVCGQFLQVERLEQSTNPNKGEGTMMKQSSPAVTALRNQFLLKQGKIRVCRRETQRQPGDEFNYGLAEILKSEITDQDERADVYGQELEEARMQSKAVA
jgi:hypothetical protein